MAHPTPILFACVLAGAAWGQARTPPPEPPPAAAPAPAPQQGELEKLAAPSVPPLPSLPVMALDEALAQADAHNLDLVQARERLEQSRLLARKAWSGYLPQLSGTGRYTRNSESAKLPFPTGYYIRDTVVVPPGSPGPNDPAQPLSPENPPGLPTHYVMFPAGYQDIEIQKQDMWNGTVSLSQALIAPALFPAIQSAYLAGEVADLSVRNARREILFATAQLYYGAEALREALSVQQRQLDALRQHENDAKVRYEVGTVPRVSYLRAQIETARAEQDLRRTMDAYLSAKSALAAMLNRDPDFDVARPPVVEPPRGDMAALVKDSPERRLDAAAARRSVELARAGRTQVWMKYLPSIGGFAQMNASNVKGFTGKETTYVAGAALTWTFLDGGLREAELAEASHRIAEAQAASRAAENKVKDEVRRAFYDLESAEANRVKAAEQVRLARENAQLIENNYDAGAATYIEVVDAQTALLGAELSSVNEGLSAELAALKLARAAGLFEPAPRAQAQ